MPRQYPRTLDETQRQPVDPEIDRERQIVPVLRRQRRQRQHRARQIDALVVGQPAADHDLGVGVIVTAGGHSQAKAPVVEQQVHFGRQRGEYFAVEKWRAHRIAWRLVEIEAESRADLEIDPTAGELADPQLGPLQVADHGDRMKRVLLDLADRLVGLLHRGMVAVAEIEPKSIGAGFIERGNHVPTVGRRAQGRENFRLALAVAHCGSPDAVISTARKSLTLVKVGPVISRSSSFSKKP